MACHVAACPDSSVWGVERMTVQPDGWVDDDEIVPEDESPDWDAWVAELDAAKEAGL